MDQDDKFVCQILLLRQGNIMDLGCVKWQTYSLVTFLIGMEKTWIVLQINYIIDCCHKYSVVVLIINCSKSQQKVNEKLLVQHFLQIGSNATQLPLQCRITNFLKFLAKTPEYFLSQSNYSNSINIEKQTQKMLHKSTSINQKSFLRHCTSKQIFPAFKVC